MAGVYGNFTVAIPRGWSRRTSRMRSLDDSFRKVVSRLSGDILSVVTITRNYQKTIVPFGKVDLTDTSPLITEDAHLVAVSDTVSSFGGVVLVGLDNTHLAEVLVETYNGFVPVDGIKAFVKRFSLMDSFVTLNSKQPRKLVLYTGEQTCTFERDQENYSVMLVSDRNLLDVLEPTEALFGHVVRWTAPPWSVVLLDVTDYTPALLVEELK